MPAFQRLGQLLLASGHLGAAELDDALRLQQASGGLLGEILERIGAVSEENVLQTLAAQTGYSLVPLGELSPEAFHAAMTQLAIGHEALRAAGAIVWLDDDGRLHASAGNPLLPEVQELLAGHAGESPVLWHFTRTQERESALDAADYADTEPASDVARLREMAEDAPVISFVNNLLAQALEQRASDIHVEPGERELHIRLRVDGVLRDHLVLPIARFAAIASRIKLVGRLDIAERRLPQDGRISLRVGGTELDVRVSAIPSVNGESIVMRLLPKHRGGLDIGRLGLEADHLATLRQWVARPTGLILVTGPTGSGKSTTLYSALSAIEDRARKIITVEDPVENRLPGVVQIQTHAEIDYTFARALRAILRHDPDIVMIGEIRDRETAEIAIQSSLTGHLVLSTLHTNNALSAITRLIDMGVERFLVGAALRGVMAQRLVRQLCADCATPDPQVPALAQTLGVDGADAHWRRPQGCERCHGTGYRGRLGIYEFVDLDDALQVAVSGGASMDDIERLANDKGRRTLLGDGVLKARAGLTTVDEVLRVVGGEEN